MTGGAPILEIKNVCLSYGERHVLCHIEQAVNDRDFIVLCGPNGGGKTTLLRLMAGLLPPTAGEIVRRKGVSIGYLPQYGHIDRRFPATVERIVGMGLLSGGKPGGFGLLRGRGAREAEEVAAVLALLDIAHLRKRPIAELSGGQWQRTLLARALVTRPALLLLDEPETHLDEAARHELYDLLGRLEGRCAVGVVSHNTREMPTFGGRRVWHVEEGAVKEAADFI